MGNNLMSLNDVTDLFEEKVSVADINAARILSEISAAIVKKRPGIKQTPIHKWHKISAVCSWQAALVFSKDMWGCLLPFPQMYISIDGGDAHILEWFFSDDAGDALFVARFGLHGKTVDLGSDGSGLADAVHIDAGVFWEYQIHRAVQGVAFHDVIEGGEGSGDRTAGCFQFRTAGDGAGNDAAGDGMEIHEALRPVKADAAHRAAHADAGSGDAF